MYHMVNGICECAQRTSSLRMCNTLNEMMRAQYCTYTHPHLFQIFVKTRERNFSKPNLPSQSCMDIYGQLDSLFFFIGILCPPGLNYKRSRPIGWFCVEVGILLESNISGILSCEKHHFKCLEIHYPGKFQEFPLFSYFRSLRCFLSFHSATPPSGAIHKPWESENVSSPSFWDLRIFADICGSFAEICGSFAST